MTNSFVIISKDVIRRNILDTAFWPNLVSDLPKEHKIILIVSEDSLSDYDQYKSDQVEVVGYTKKGPAGLNKILDFFIRTTLDSHSVRTYRNRAMARKECSRASFIVKAFMSNTFGRWRFFKNFLRFLFLKTSSRIEIEELYEKYQPQTVFTPSMIDNDFDAQFAKVAKQKKVKIVGMVRSWDNFNNHGLLSVIPDVFYFQNIFLQESAEKFQAIDLSRIKHEIVGLPHYDSYFDSTPYVQEREAFFESMGLDPNKKLILFGGSDFYYSEDSLPRILNDITNLDHMPPTQIIFRPHPSSIFDVKDYGLDELENVTLDDAFRGGKFKDHDKFVNLMFHSDIIINIASTLSIDAAVFDRPAICINFDSEEKKLSKYEKVDALYTHFDHYERLVSKSGVSLPKSREELTECIEAYFENPSLHSEGRKQIIEEFVSPYDGESGKRLATLLRSELSL